MSNAELIESMIQGLPACSTRVIEGRRQPFFAAKVAYPDGVDRVGHVVGYKDDHGEIKAVFRFFCPHEVGTDFPESYTKWIEPAAIEII